MSAPRRRNASTTGPIGRTRAWGSPSMTTGPSARAATAGRKRITVPARPQSMRVSPPSTFGGLTSQSSTAPVTGSPSGRASSMRTPKLRRACAMSSVSRDRSGARRRERSDGEGRDHEVAVGQRLAAGQRDDGVDRAIRHRGGPVGVPPVRAGTGGGWRGGTQLSSRRPWPGGRAGGPRAMPRAWRGGPPCASPCPRAGPATRARGVPRCRRRRAAGRRAARRS